MKIKPFLGLVIVALSSSGAAVCNWITAPPCQEKLASCPAPDAASVEYEAGSICITNGRYCCKCRKGFIVCTRPNNGGSYSGPAQNFVRRAAVQDAYCDPDGGTGCLSIADDPGTGGPG